MLNKKQASLILRVNRKENPSYLIQIRDNVENAKFKFPGVLSLFGGEVDDFETGKEGFLREMYEEIKGINFESVKLEHRVYDWKKDLERVGNEINGAVKNNFNVFRGFNYDDFIPGEALGKDRDKKTTFRDLFYAVKEDHYFVGETDQIGDLDIHEGKGIILPEQICRTAILYPTDKIALMHDYVMRKKSGEEC